MSLALMLGAAGAPKAAGLIGVQASETPSVGAPLADETSGFTATPCVTPKEWKGAPPMSLAEGWEWEAEQIRRLRGPGQLVPVGDFDSKRPPVIMVGGMQPSHWFLRDAADFLSADSAADGRRRTGKQVLFFVYDRNKSMDDVGKELADSIADLKEHYGESTDLDIVSNSAAGLIVWAALNELENPGWMKEASQKVRSGRRRSSRPPNDSLSDRPPNPRGGFEHIRVRSYDTPGSGLPDTWVRTLVNALLPAASLYTYIDSDVEFIENGVDSVKQLSSDSRFMRNLFNKKLSGVTLKNHGAGLEMSFDHIHWTMRDFLKDAWNQLIVPLQFRTKEELGTIARFVLGESDPTESHLKNFCHLLQHDVRFVALRDRLEALLGAGDKTSVDEAMRRAFLDSMPPLPDTHGELPYHLEGVEDLRNPRGADNDWRSHRSECKPDQPSAWTADDGDE